MVTVKKAFPLWRWLFAIIVLASAAGAYYVYVYSVTDDEVSYVTVSKGSIENIVTATGRLQPRNFVDVGAQVSGQLIEILVDVGDQVEEGQLLAEIDSTVYRANVDGTRAQLRNLEAQMQDRKAQLELAQIQLRRQRQLVSNRMTSEESLQIAEASQRSAEAQVQALAAQIDQTSSTLRAEEARLNYSQIFAPMSGTVVNIVARQGQTINATQQAPTIMQIADLSVMTVQAQVSEADVSRLSTGMEAYFTTLGNQSRRWSGQLRRIEPTPQVENNVVLFNALFDVDNHQMALLPQMTAQVFFIVDKVDDVLMLPVNAISGSSNRQAGVAKVKLLLPDGSIEEREVITGLSNRVQIEIKEGLSLEDQVVTPQGSQRAGNAQSTQTGMRPR
ncbi:efflux RND transporter periplasmic adaptor subunit [Nitrincola schmidtii]|uniref:efflux RND transporter periplasmic adaptor subunit n=1 Tax=Nitrincola schmidtii TaxID=1730894 RepID=UPI00124EC188|nr:efflux RND transporter periplasmic adaptor subunit [Nitrincola schmidtii]